MHIVSKNFDKTLVCRREYDVIFLRHKQGISATMTTTRHCSSLEFGKGAANQAVAPGITRPLNATAADI